MTSLIDNDLLDSLLVGQKDRILSHINCARDLHNLASISDQLLLLKPLWCASGYGYKYDELVALWKTKLDELTEEKQ